MADKRSAWSKIRDFNPLLDGLLAGKALIPENPISRAVGGLGAQALDNMDGANVKYKVPLKDRDLYLEFDPTATQAMGVVKKLVPWKLQRALLGGVDPTDLSKVEYGKVVKDLANLRRRGKDPVSEIRSIWAELNGARAIDKTGSSDARKILEKIGAERGISRDLQPALREFTAEGPLTREQANSYGLYTPKRFEGGNTIEIVRRNTDSVRPENPELKRAGVVAHEGQHWLEDMLHPEFQSLPEIIGSGPKKDLFGLQGFYSNERLHDMLEHLHKTHPEKGYIDQLPKTSALIRKLAKWGRKYSWTEEPLLSAWVDDMSKIYRDAQFAKDPYLAQRMKSLGHMKEYAAFEPEFSQIDLAAQNARHGGENHPDLSAHPLVKKAERDYASGIRPQGENFSAKKRKFKVGPWEMIGAAMTGAGATYGAVKLAGDGQDDPEFQAAVERLRTYLNRPK
jgi:hypothetical protein